MTDQEIHLLLNDIANEAKQINQVHPGTAAADPRNYSLTTVRNAASILQREVNLLLEADRLLNAALAVMTLRHGPTGVASKGSQDQDRPDPFHRDAVIRQSMWWIRLIIAGRQRAIVNACDGYVHPGIVTCFGDQFSDTAARQPAPSPSVHCCPRATMDCENK